MCFLSPSESPATGSAPCAPGVVSTPATGSWGEEGGGGRWDVKREAGERHFKQPHTWESLLRPCHFAVQTVEELHSQRAGILFAGPELLQLPEE